MIKIDKDSGLPHSHPLEQTSKVEGRRDANASSQAQTLLLSTWRGIYL